MTEKINWYHCPIDREKLVELTQKKNLLPLAHTTGQLLLSAATGLTVYLCWKYTVWPFWMIAIYVHCSLYKSLTPDASIHELSHKTVFKARWLNEFFIMLFSFLSWTNYEKFRVSHLQMHHRYTLHKDRDLEVLLPINYRPIDWFFCFTIPLYSLQNVTGIFDFFDEIIRHCFGITKGSLEERLFLEENKKEFRKVCNWARIMLIGHLLLAGLFIYHGLWILLFVVTFARIIAPGFGLLLTLPQHIGLKPNINDFRICCRTMLLNKFLRFMYWNMNYHIEHHMYAAVPYYNLPKLYELIKDDMPEAKSGLWNNWKDILSIMERRKNEPGYCFVAELPNSAT